MTRARLRLNYGDAAPAPAFAGFDPDVPLPGWYKTRLRSGGAVCGVRIWYGAPLDPVTGEEMDRSHRWQAHLNGAYIDLERVWPRCAADPITEADYDHYCRVSAWARDHAPESGFADPTKRIDPLSVDTPLPF